MVRLYRKRIVAVAPPAELEALGDRACSLGEEDRRP
jgi:hypothetical protein